MGDAPRSRRPVGSRAAPRAAALPSSYDERVFINAPFDRRYRPMFRALVFAVHDCGFQARCALESDDGSVVRLDKLLDIIEHSRFGIHDISRTTLDARHRLPRFNMPLELGVFLGAKRYGGARQKRKAVLILDKEPFRHQKSCSDIAGQDVRAHRDDAWQAIQAVRDWLQLAPVGRRAAIPSWTLMVERYRLFMKEMPLLCRPRGLDPRHLTFFDYQTLVVGWLAANPDWAPHP